MCVCVRACAAYKVRVKSSAAEGDFMTYSATVVEVLKNSHKGQILPPCTRGARPRARA